MMKNDKINLNIKKPAPFYAPGSEKPVTEEDIKRRREKVKRAALLGIDLTRFTIESDEEFVNPYKIIALSYIAKGEEIPKELLLQIEEFEKENEHLLKEK